ncbi:AAA family ATPase [Myxococcota bacterium]|nr:AAA family ATPase [Myxococcota bacterium]MBU1380322.1 AAA family ATPase [Myxococcota bacterium]MBU1495310.1 AAA family ATPase [Myxococcota bacterium]
MDKTSVLNENAPLPGLHECIEFLVGYTKPSERVDLTIVSLLEKTIIAEKNGDYGYDLSDDDLYTVKKFFNNNDGLFKASVGLNEPFALCGSTLMTHRMKKAIEDINTVLTDKACKSGFEILSKHDNLSPEQNNAVKNALENRISIITGGPGTGKTSVIAQIVQTFVEITGNTESIAVCAPTGKAANRVGEVLFRYPDIKPQTVHRLCGYSPSGGYYLHNSENRLAYDLVIVDESSMLDLYTARQLAVSLKTDCILVLVGDAFQLPPVGSGRFFNDIVDFSDKHQVPISKLTKNFRSEGVSLGHFVEKCRTGDFSPDDTFKDVHFEQVMIEKFTQITDYKINPIWTRPVAIPDDLKLKDPIFLDEWKKLNSQIILTPVNSGPMGTEEINKRIFVKYGDFFAGMRIIMNKNNYTWNIFNGDMGIIIPGIYQTNETLWAAFPENDYFRTIPVSEISTSISGAHAVTVHRSQGSEFNEVILLLPPNAANLTPQLIYTAVSRARKKVTVYGDINQFSAILKVRQKRKTSLFSFSNNSKDDLL